MVRPRTYEELIERIELKRKIPNLTYEDIIELQKVLTERKEELREELPKKKVRELDYEEFLDDDEFAEWIDYWGEREISKWNLRKKRPETWLKQSYPQWKSWDYRQLKTMVNANYNQSPKVRAYVLKKLLEK